MKNATQANKQWDALSLAANQLTEAKFASGENEIAAYNRIAQGYKQLLPCFKGRRRVDSERVLASVYERMADTTFDHGDQTVARDLFFEAYRWTPKQSVPDLPALLALANSILEMDFKELPAELAESDVPEFDQLIDDYTRLIEPLVRQARRQVITEPLPTLVWDGLLQATEYVWAAYRRIAQTARTQLTPEFAHRLRFFADRVLAWAPRASKQGHHPDVERMIDEVDTLERTHSLKAAGFDLV